MSNNFSRNSICSTGSDSYSIYTENSLISRNTIDTRAIAHTRSGRNSYSHDEIHAKHKKESTLYRIRSNITSKFMRSKDRITQAQIPIQIQPGDKSKDIHHMPIQSVDTYTNISVDTNDSEEYYYSDYESIFSTRNS